ncbi:hypothetical protein FGO68_gene10432 [Halteria grandinella]|uniref:DUF4203 domain-containing protein n=1 Tax=Halteria grandinella TaxID=5974 RepID=A0A8J8NLL8_HALGN|nr:hypothetical protein FGO68_gene10432 [Halteria grandinella]
MAIGDSLIAIFILKLINYNIKEKFTMMKIPPPPLTLHYSFNLYVDLPVGIISFIVGLAFLVFGRRYSKQLLATVYGVQGVLIFLLSIAFADRQVKPQLILTGLFMMGLAWLCYISQRVANFFLGLTCSTIAFYIAVQVAQPNDALLLLYLAGMLGWAVYSCRNEKNKDLISAQTSLIGSDALYLAFLIFINGTVDLLTYARLPGYLLVLVGGLFGWFLNKQLWEKYDKIDEEQEQQAASNLGNYQRAPAQQYVGQQQQPQSYGVSINVGYPQLQPPYNGTAYPNQYFGQQQVQHV